VPTQRDTGYRLPCGMRVDELLNQVADHAAHRDPDHQRTCRHCHATLAELTALWQPVHDLAAEDVQPPANLLEAVMLRVRALPRSTWHAVIPNDSGAGETRIAARVVAAVARLAAESVPHVSIALGGGHLAADLSASDATGHHAETATDVVVAGTHVVIDVQIAVEHGAHIPDVAAQVRTQITRHITAHTGLTTAAVNVNVTDVRPRR
jgi:uncharacterized alkaline shock family protein YloU